MDEHITEDIMKELQEYQVYLEDKEVQDDPYILSQRLTVLNAVMARTGYLLAVAKKDYDEAMAAVFAQESKSILKMPATISAKFISSQCSREEYFVTWIDRLNRNCVHAADNIRTQVSFAKENLSLTRRGY